MLDYFETWENVSQHTQLLADATNELVAPFPLIPEKDHLLWLSTPYCGFVCNVLDIVLEKQGIRPERLINREFRNKVTSQHVILELSTYSGSVYIDPTYLQLLAEFGIDGFIRSEDSPNYGGIFPEDKILAFTKDSVPEVVDWMSGLTRSLLNKWQNTTAWHVQGPWVRPTNQPTRNQLDDFFSDVYNFDNYQPWESMRQDDGMIIKYLESYKPGEMSIEAILRSIKATSKE